MSHIIGLLDSVEICCPNCEKHHELEQLDVSTIIDLVTISRPIDECSFIFTCDCGQKLKINPEMHIQITKV